MQRSEDWLRQARKDLNHARKASEGRDYEWACFSAQQAAEKAVKGLFQSLNREAWGYSVSKLLASLPEDSKADEELIEKAKQLDRHYIPTRYPNFHPEGAPMDYYTKNDALRAVKCAEEILGFCEGKGS